MKQKKLKKIDEMIQEIENLVKIKFKKEKIIFELYKNIWGKLDCYPHTCKELYYNSSVGKKAFRDYHSTDQKLKRLELKFLAWQTARF